MFLYKQISVFLMYEISNGVLLYLYFNVHFVMISNDITWTEGNYQFANLEFSNWFLFHYKFGENFWDSIVHNLLLYLTGTQNQGWKCVRDRGWVQKAVRYYFSLCYKERKNVEKIIF